MLSFLTIQIDFSPVTLLFVPTGDHLPRRESPHFHLLRAVRHLPLFPIEAPRDGLQHLLPHDALPGATLHHHLLLRRHRLHYLPEVTALL